MTPIPVAVSVCTFGSETPAGSSIIDILGRLGLRHASLLDIRRVLKFNVSDAAYCHGYQGDQGRVLRAVIGNDEFVPTMFKCLGDSADLSSGRMHLVIRVDDAGSQQSCVVGMMEVEALNSMFIDIEDGAEPIRVFNARHFAFHDMPESEITSGIEAAMDWTWQETVIEAATDIDERYRLGFEPY